jgi:hypothetical protein
MNIISDENLSIFYIDNIEDVPDNDTDINEIMNELQNMQSEYKIDLQHNQSNLDKYNIPELLKICEYYGFLKYVKMAKYKKIDIIEAIETFEKSSENFMIVNKRQKLWYYINELSNDKFMKRFIIW